MQGVQIMQVTSKQMQLMHCVIGPAVGISSSVASVAVGLAFASLLDAMVERIMRRVTQFFVADGVT